MMLLPHTSTYRRQDKNEHAHLRPRKPKTYQLNPEQTLFLGGLGRFDFVAGDKQGFTSYFYNELKLHRTKLEGASDFYDKHQADSRVFWMDKRHYSAFSGTDLDIRLRERRVTTVVLTGVLTDICVLHTAIDAYNLGYDIEVVASATASLTPEAHDFAIGHFKNVLGATIVE